MRMRKLGRGQAVTFVVLPEMQQRIRKLLKLSPSVPLTMSHALRWSIFETCVDLRKSIPLWATQGIRHQRQETIWRDRVAAESSVQVKTSAEDVSRYLEEEAQSLRQRYQPKGEPAIQVLLRSLVDPRLESCRNNLTIIQQRCRDYDILSFDGAELQEEQERELSPEMEEERQSENPPPRTPAIHNLHPAVKSFVSTGCLSQVGTAFLPAFSAFKDSSAVSFFQPHQFSSDIYVTRDFGTTVTLVPGSISDLYQRPVQWVVISSTDPKRSISDFMVIMSPWEVNSLYSDFKSSSNVTLHQYTPRTNATLPTLEHLLLCTIPPRPSSWAAPGPMVTQLNLFAGQIWLKSYDEYTALCRYLGLSYESGDEKITADGFAGKTSKNPSCRFDKSPVAFLNAVFTKIRRDCQDIRRTHMGRVLAGEILRVEDFDDRV
jgi:hypothetical protein